MSTSPQTRTGDVLRRASSPRSRQRAWTLLLVVGMLLILVGGWTYNTVQETIRDSLTKVLHTILNANVEALRIMADNERAHIMAWGKDPDVRILTEQLLSGNNPDYARSKLTQILDSVLADEGYLGYAIVDPHGIIQATDQPEAYLGKKLTPVAMKLLNQVLAGEVSFGKPYLKNNLFEGDEERTQRAVLLAKAPIPNLDGQNIAALVMTVDPEKDFTRILSVAQLGHTGSTYAFDDQGFMLSESRHEEQLKELGLIPNRPEASAILTLQLRDPEVDLTRGQTARLPVAERPLTRMAEVAALGLPGVDVEGYRDYRGVKVVGAWQWLPDYGFGVATEIERTEALISLRPVRMAFAGLFALLVLAAGGFLLAGHFARRLQKEIDELRELGQYTLVEKIGEGGMGKVYKARHAMLRRPTAIKLIREDQLDEKALERFEQEVQITSQLTHPNTISIYDYGHSPDGVFYYVMEYLSGITVGQLVNIEHQVPPERVVYILKQVCGSLAEAHAQGLIHRDIKPGNVMLCQRGGTHGVVKVLDFGLVREIEPRRPQDLVQQLQIMGTPGFIAPELLVTDRKVDARSDLYAVGALGFLMLTGKLVFDKDNLDVMLQKIVNSDPPRPSERTEKPIPKELDDLIFACLARDPEQRPASADELAQKLADLPLDKKWTSQDARRWWEEKSKRIEFERKLERPERSSMSETVMDIDLGERS